MNNDIKLLDNITISKIAAGEIIERPFSVVKELIENSIDANSNNIIIQIANGGKDYIRVTDNGVGIKEEQIDLAFLRHSTSKISNIDDLENIYSLGFRGEALASICMVSKVETLTRTSDSIKGIRVLLEEGKIVNKDWIGCPTGTSMIVKDLFYNIPVRQKFLKKDTVEGNLISDVVYKLALGNPEISFKYIKDNKITLKTPGNGNISSNIYSVLGKDFIDNLKYFSYNDKSIEIEGFLSKNNFHRGNRKHQYIFVNGRCVKNDEITKTIEGCYKSLIPINKYPVFILYIKIDPKMIDVNIHPTKEEIKFTNQDELNNLFNKITKNNLNEIVTIPKIEVTQIGSEKESMNFLDELIFDNKLDKVDNKIDISNETIIDKNYKNHKDIFNECNSIEESINTYNPKVEDYSLREKSINISNAITNSNIVGVLFRTYIILEDRNQDEFYILDQHAAHERIMYEKYKDEFENEEVVIQKLLTPLIIDLTSSEMDVVVEHKPLFISLGFDIEEFGINTIALRGVPLVFGKPNMEKLFFDVLDNIKDDIKSNYDLNTDKIAKIACSNAIKGGDKISNIEIKELLNQLLEVKNPYTCPHGRPVIIKMNRRELEKEFSRIM
ncbi:DNA mismatch repair endonuclease MutL [Anaerosalibacter sp. Marseille-P3206]|uniref:DNA mismatch repair endonuclease MutL n=1 Tax=Anaerosalibacter sp. Marseille-P3206 TaxID=1871005 RepID=UPI000BE7DBF7|nr:DNA mismatch repair endonuclease MutL [Anaerosalibacter sp. Marseille-P3206]